jgi:hypothetical protein
MRPSIFDTSPPLFLDRPDSLTRRLPFDFRMSFLLLPWIYLVPCTISHIISFLFFIRHRIIFSFVAIHRHSLSVGHPLQLFSIISLAHTPFQPFYFFFYLFYIPSAITSLFLPLSFYFVVCFYSDVLFPCRLMIHFLTCLVKCEKLW